MESFEDEKMMRLLIWHAIGSGCLIAESDNGFFQPETLEELQTYYRAIRNRRDLTDNMKKMAVAAVRKAIKKKGEKA